MQPEVCKYIEGVKQEDFPPIALEMSTNSRITEIAKTTFIYGTGVAYNRSYLIEILTRMGIDIAGSVIGGGFTVAFMSIFIALRMGASKVIILGQDLAYEADLYVEGAVFQTRADIIEVNGQRYFQQFDAVHQQMSFAEVIEIDHWSKKGKTFTMSSLNAARLLLEKRVKDGKITNIVNATEGGAYIDGLEHISLKKAYNKYIKANTVDKTKLKPFKIKSDFSTLPEKTKSIEELLERFKKVKEIADKGIDTLTQVRASLDLISKGEILSEPEIKRLRLAGLVTDEILRTLQTDYQQELRYVATSSPTSHYLFKMIESINRSDYTEKAINTDNWNKIALMLGSIQEGIDFFIQGVEELLDTIHKDYAKYLKKKK